MAIRAVSTERLFMHIVGPMAVETLLLGNAEYRCLMAAFTTRHRMLANQWKCAQVVVVTDVLQPGGFLVAVIAMRPQVLLMGIVLLVTAVTSGIDFLCFGSQYMAGVANQVLVRTIEREIGIGIVIEFGLLPSSDDMAFLTLLAVQSLVLIVGTMAVVATTSLVFLFRCLVASRVAGIAGSATVFAFERIIRIAVMIEAGFIPGLLAVAGFAFFTESVGMDVSYRVAVDALPGSILVCPLDMTGVTGHLLVRKF